MLSIRCQHKKDDVTLDRQDFGKTIQVFTPEITSEERQSGLEDNHAGLEASDHQTTPQCIAAHGQDDLHAPAVLAFATGQPKSRSVVCNKLRRRNT